MTPSLVELCLEAVVQHIGACSSLGGIPEDLCCVMFERVLQLGKLRPKVLELFQATNHELLMQRIHDLGIQDLPAQAYSSRNSWLGDKPTLY
mmetsp:Transcript_16177/g.45081  ORF Transcript_16177/g.45081 Transcript_16177/m.45081 type:complete len:92 (+) Transcript_16177:238-513(+)